jgi:hypothetical protein
MFSDVFDSPDYNVSTYKSNTEQWTRMGMEESGHDLNCGTNPRYSRQD